MTYTIITGPFPGHSGYLHAHYFPSQLQQVQIPSSWYSLNVHPLHVQHSIYPPFPYFPYGRW
ncbi:hypothetical protein M3182_17040 [Mesobacillus maritimus]|uniref:hypothetical protein n=1 Tax=Mesobacillus maritimus TaxID=1643336 RepID=UPI00204218DC|nr:hypothetical protein [Mesobacillus maritimus]MCM3587443.1 hypothetical protein [Mesobacillus maritimus]MCM3672177.1 hypothetical protein [Mesobacillus maritimus]